MCAPQFEQLCRDIGGAPQHYLGSSTSSVGHLVLQRPHTTEMGVLLVVAKGLLMAAPVTLTISEEATCIFCV